MDKRYAIGLLSRYIFLIILAIPNFYLIYLIANPLTIYPVFWALQALYGAKLLAGNIIFFKGYYAEIIGACIGGAAYYLLIILNLTTPMQVKTRIKSLLFIILSFLILNIVRILIFASLLKIGYQYFDITHELTWYFGSTVLVVIVWFANVLI